MENFFFFFSYALDPLRVKKGVEKEWKQNKKENSERTKRSRRVERKQKGEWRENKKGEEIICAFHRDSFLENKFAVLDGLICPC